MIHAILMYDAALVEKFNTLVGHGIFLDAVIKICATYLIYLVPIILIGCWIYSRHSKAPALQMGLAAVFTWLIFDKLFSAYIWYRPRPYSNSAISVNELIFHRPDYSFPSDHASVLMALAVSAWLLGFKKLGWWLLALMFVIGITRIIIGVHYPLDVIGGIIAGTLGALIINLLKRPLTKYIYNPVIQLAQKLHLA